MDACILNLISRGKLLARDLLRGRLYHRKSVGERATKFPRLQNIINKNPKKYIFSIYNFHTCRTITYVPHVPRSRRAAVVCSAASRSGVTPHPPSLRSCARRKSMPCCPHTRSWAAAYTLRQRSADCAHLSSKFACEQSKTWPCAPVLLSQSRACERGFGVSGLRVLRNSERFSLSSQMQKLTRKRKKSMTLL